MRRAIRCVFATCAVLAAAAVAASACASFNDSPDDAPAADAARDTTASEDVSSLADTSTPDVVAPDVVTDAKPTSPCVGTSHWLCDDFDRDAAAGFPAWDPSIVGDASLLGIIALSSAPSAPNVVSARAGDGQSARLVKAHNASAKGLRCEFDMAVEQRSSSAVILFDITLGAANYYYRAELRGAPDVVFHYGTVDGGNLTSPGASTSFTQAWQHVVVDVGVVDAGLQVQVRIDGNSLPLVVPDAGGLEAPSVQTVALGLQSLADAGDWVVRYDNVHCD